MSTGVLLDRHIFPSTTLADDLAGPVSIYPTAITDQTECPGMSMESLDIDPFDLAFGLNLPFGDLWDCESLITQTAAPSQIYEATPLTTSPLSLNGTSKKKPTSPSQTDGAGTDRKERRREQNRRSQQMYRQRQENLVSGLRALCAELRRENQELKTVLQRSATWSEDLFYPDNSGPPLKSEQFACEPSPALETTPTGDRRRMVGQCLTCMNFQACSNVGVPPLIKQSAELPLMGDLFGSLKS